jgi:hypothetical protein
MIRRRMRLSPTRSADARSNIERRAAPPFDAMRHAAAAVQFQHLQIARAD